MEIVILVLALGVAALAAGFIAGLFGVGGGIILVPAFFILFSTLGYNHPQLMHISVATSLATITVTSLRSLMAHNKKDAVNWEILVAWAAPIGLGSVMAVFVAQELRTQIMFLIFGVAALAISIILGAGLGRAQIKDTMPEGVTKWALGLAIGFVSTLMGIGGGSFAVPLMVMHGRPIHNAVATAAGFGALIAFPSVLAFALSIPIAGNLPPWMLGFINLPAFTIVIMLTSLSAPIGAQLAHRLDQKWLGRLFAVFIALVALNMIRKAFAG